MRIHVQIAVALSLVVCELCTADNLHFKQVGYPDMVAYDVSTGKRSNILLQSSEVKYSTILWGDEIIVNLGSSKEAAYRRIYRQKDIEIDQQGYQFYRNGTYDFVDGTRDNRILVLSGAGFFLSQYYKVMETKRLRDASDEVMIRLKQNAAPNANYGLDNPYYGFVDDGIAYISAWSELRETLNGKVVRYKAENMKRPLIVGVQETVGVELNQIDPPWVEGAAGPGIGGIIDIEFARVAKELIILNGYVDFTRRDLYKKNNRLKTVRIDSVDPAFSTTVTLEDVVRFHEVALPAPTTKVQLTILDVYKGTKYDDTCISKMFIPQEELRSRAAYEAEIEKALRQAGYLK